VCAWPVLWARHIQYCITLLYSVNCDSTDVLGTILLRKAIRRAVNFSPRGNTERFRVYFVSEEERKIAYMCIRIRRSC
jgi:hypothetical protein